LIVGDGPHREKLRKRSIDSGVKDRIIFTGRVSYRDLPKYFEVCDVFVLPSISRLEAFGLVVVEAMASGKPVVISDIPGVMELVTDGVEGLHAEPMNSEDLGNKIKALLSDESQRNQMGKNARKRVEEQFNWDTVISKIEDVYNEVVK
jgi:glycosyltransferase involved in cell wall biosynthesis